MSGGALQLWDSHVHLQDPALGPNLDTLLKQASDLGICYWICNGTCEADWPRVFELAQSHSRIIPCFGLHPWYVSQRTPDWLQRLGHYLNQTTAGVGEIGLDRWIENRDEPAQEEVFRAQLRLAQRYRRPIMVHCLRAWDWLMKVLREESPFPEGLLIHAYGGPAELISPLAELGAYFSFAGNILEERKVRQQQALRQVPRDRLLLETDAPDMLPPKPYRLLHQVGPDGKEINVPGNLRLIFKGMVKLLQEPEDQLARVLWANSQRFISKLNRPL